MNFGSNCRPLHIKPWNFLYPKYPRKSINSDRSILSCWIALFVSAIVTTRWIAVITSLQFTDIKCWVYRDASIPNRQTATKNERLSLFSIELKKKVGYLARFKGEIRIISCGPGGIWTLDLFIAMAKNAGGNWKKQFITSTIAQNQQSTRCAPCRLFQRISTQFYPRCTRGIKRGEVARSLAWRRMQ